MKKLLQKFICYTTREVIDVETRQEPSEDYEEYLKAEEKVRVAKLEAQKTFEKILKS